MHKQDVAYMQGFEERYGMRRDVTRPDNDKKFGEEELRVAVAEFKLYILGIRADTDQGFREDAFSANLDESYLLREQERPSNARIAPLCNLFLNLPGVKRASMDVHAEKLERGIPRFRRVMDASLPETGSLDGYFAEVSNIMENSLVVNLDPEKFAFYKNLGLIMGYQRDGIRRPENTLLHLFAVNGVGTFISELRRVVSGTINDNVDVEERVRSEFLDKEGTIYQMMRVSIEDIEDAQASVADTSLTVAKAILSSKDYSSGACPAILPTKTKEDQQRPIAYEYATIITSHIPPKFLRAA
jgi:hypothetical protein